MRRAQVRIQPRTQRRAVARAVVAIVEAVERKPVMAEQRQFAIQRFQLIKIEQNGEHAVSETVFFWVHALVHDPAPIEGRFQRAARRHRYSAATRWLSISDKGASRSNCSCTARAISTQRTEALIGTMSLVHST